MKHDFPTPRQTPKIRLFIHFDVYKTLNFRMSQGKDEVMTTLQPH